MDFEISQDKRKTLMLSVTMDDSSVSNSVAKLPCCPGGR